MFSPGFRALYIVSTILFLVPWSLLFSAWLAFNRAKVAAPLSIWRRYLVVRGAVSGICFNGIKYRVERFLAQAWR